MENRQDVFLTAENTPVLISLFLRHVQTPRGKSFVYDSVFSKEVDFNTKQTRDDRRHNKMLGLQIFREEDAKPVPSRHSSDYGHYLRRHCDPLDRSHVHIQYVETQFFRRNGVDFKGLTEQ